MFQRSAFLLAALLLPSWLLAAGSDSSAPPPATPTTETCTNGMVWDAKAKACVTPKHSGLGDEVLYQAARELAYDGQYLQAIAVLDAMADQESDRVMTYRGFVQRKLGNQTAARAWYAKALDRNPDNFLARSYLGQGMLEDGDLLGARAQLLEIRARGGTGTWAEVSLQSAIETGTTYAF